jgi:hypothetical protein
MAETGYQQLLHEKQQSGTLEAPAPPQQQQPAVQPQSIVKNAIYTPHSFLALSVCVAVFCGICNPLTLACTILAAITSAMVSDIIIFMMIIYCDLILTLCQSYSASTDGKLLRGRNLGNCSLILIVSALVTGLVMIFFGLLVPTIIIVFLTYCNTGGPTVCNRMI